MMNYNDYTLVVGWFAGLFLCDAPLAFITEHYVIKHGSFSCEFSLMGVKG